MKLPFNKILNPVIKPYFRESKILCEHPIFTYSLFYIYFYGTAGFFLNVNHLRKHLGEVPDEKHYAKNEVMLLHDLNIIATSMGVFQYACLLVGCSTENPALFLPHLAWQLVVAFVKILNAFLQLTHVNLKTFRQKILTIIVMAFNWSQEFCVFRRYLCICDL